MKTFGDFAALMDASSPARGARPQQAPRQGEEVEGTIVQISPDLVFIDIGGPADASIPRAELMDAEGNVKVKVGDRLKAIVVDTRGDGPRLALRLGSGDRKGDRSVVDLALASGAPVEGKVTAVIKGGLQVEIGGLRAFCPASQVDTTYVADLAAFDGQTVTVMVLEVRDEGRSVVVSRRAWLDQQRKGREQELRTQLVVGEVVQGTVTEANSKGVVVDLGGVTGFVPVRELPASMASDPGASLQPGDGVSPRVLSVEDSDRGLRVRLSLRDASAETTRVAPQPDEVLAATVVGVLDHGVVVNTAKGDGLVPVRELELTPGADHRRAFPKGATFEVVAMPAAPGSRTRFSAKRVAEVKERAQYREYSGASKGAASASFGSLGDLLRARLEPKGAEPAAVRKKSR
jgi:small subunit ribosomal protein S1